MKRLGLSLSGGGYRAAAFHLGTLKKLEELAILNRVDVISTISGGSITGAAWALYQGDYASFHKEMKNKLHERDVISYVLKSWIFIRMVLLVLLLLGGAIILSFSNFSWAVFPILILFFAIIFRYQYKIFPVSRAIEKAYDKFFYDGKMLKDFKAKPVMAIGSSNLHTGKPFTFSQTKMTDSAYSKEYDPPIRFNHCRFPVSRAVMSSSCVPFAFTPVFIDQEFFAVSSDAKRIRPVLVDGGVYDNQGIQKLTQNESSYECDIIITSDAGGQFINNKTYPNAIALLIRTVDLFMYRIKAFQMQQNVYQHNKSRPIAYFSLGWKLDRIIPGFVDNLANKQILQEVIEAHKLNQEWVENPGKYRSEIINYLKSILGYDKIATRDLSPEEFGIAIGTGTNLTRLSKRQIDCLIRHAENLTELQVKLYCPKPIL